MELKLKGNKIICGDKEITLTDEQLKELEIDLEPFDTNYGDKVFFIRLSGDIDSAMFNNYIDENIKLLRGGKICKDKNLMKQKALHQNLNDLLWKFTIENGWSDDLWKDKELLKWFIQYDCKTREFIISWNNLYKKQGAIYFISEEIAQRAIDEIVKPYMEENPEFVW